MAAFAKNDCCLCKNNKLFIKKQGYYFLCHSFLVFLHIMKVILIGAGNLATNLGKALRGIGVDVLQVFSRTMESASALAQLVGAEAVNDIAAVRDDADLYVFSVKDSALQDLVSRLCPRMPGKLFVHTAGSMPMDVFKGVARRYGVFYPMQTFSKSKEVDFQVIPCFIEAVDDDTLCQLESLAHQLSQKVYRLSSADRKYLHLSAVFACNFVNHCFAMSQQVLAEHGVPFDVMLPLIGETVRKIHTLSPLEAQTGPAVRYDENVIHAQSKLLEGNPLWKEIYDSMSKDIHKMAVEAR